MSLSQDITGIVHWFEIDLSRLRYLHCVVTGTASVRGKAKRQQCLKYKNMQAKVSKYWEEFTAGERNSQQLLRACSHLNGPTM